MKYTKRAISFLLIVTMLLAMIPAAIPVVSAAISRPEVYDSTGNNNATAGAITIAPGDKLIVNGTGVTSGIVVEIYWDTVVASAQINTTTGKSDASFECVVTVPDIAAGAFSSPQPYISSLPAAPRSVAVDSRFCLTWSGVQFGCSAKIKATTPATWGEAIDVPWKK